MIYWLDFKETRLKIFIEKRYNFFIIGNFIRIRFEIIFVRGRIYICAFYYYFFLIFKEPYYSNELSAEPIVVNTEVPDNKEYNFDPGKTMEEETLPVSAKYLHSLITLFFSLKANRYITVITVTLISFLSNFDIFSVKVEKATCRMVIMFHLKSCASY